MILALAAFVLQAADLRIQVLTPFRLTRLVIEAPQIELGAQRSTLTRPLELKAEAGRVSCREGSGSRLTASGPSIVLHLPDGTRRMYRGALEVSASKGVLQAVITMKLEDAVASVVDAEMPSAAMEARKAQAVAVRSYFIASPSRHRGFEFCDTTHCQFLKGIPGDLRAAATTQALTLRYQGRTIGAMYFRNCGGLTMRAADVGLDGTVYPYFHVTCDACRRNPEWWKMSLPLSAAEMLNHHENERLELTRQFGWNSLRSNDYQSVRSGDHMEVTGKGHGHGVGMCQRGAAAMAASGHGFTAILKHYYPQTTTE